MLRVTTLVQRSKSSFTSDVVVIGAGIVGASTALALARQGRKVTVVDAKHGAGEGTTSFSSGCLRTFYSVHSAAHLSWESYQYFQRWYDRLPLEASRRGGMRLRTTGGMVLDTPAASEFLKAVRTTSLALKIPVEYLDAKNTRERCKLLGWETEACYQPQRLDDVNFGQPLPDCAVSGAAYFPETAYVSDPRCATQDMSIAAANLGASFLYHHRVAQINTASDGRIVDVVCSTGPEETVRIHTPVVINCAGPHSNLVNEMAFGPRRHFDDRKIKTRALRSEVVIVDAPPNINYDAHGMMLGDFDLGLYSRPEFGNRILIGGVEPACDHLEWVDEKDDPDKIAQELGDQVEHHLHRMALRIPTLTIPPHGKRRGVVSTYDCTPDWSPVIDGSLLKGYFMNIGTSGNCFKSAPIMGEMMAQLVAAVEAPECGGTITGHDNGSHTVKYPAVETGGLIDLSAFSRLRSAYGATNVLG